MKLPLCICITIIEVFALPLKAANKSENLNAILNTLIKESERGSNYEKDYVKIEEEDKHSNNESEYKRKNKNNNDRYELYETESNETETIESISEELIIEINEPALGKDKEETEDSILRSSLPVGNNDENNVFPKEKIPLLDTPKQNKTDEYINEKNTNKINYSTPVEDNLESGTPIAGFNSPIVTYENSIIYPPEVTRTFNIPENYVMDIDLPDFPLPVIDKTMTNFETRDPELNRELSEKMVEEILIGLSQEHIDEFSSRSAVPRDMLLEKKIHSILKYSLQDVLSEEISSKVNEYFMNNPNFPSPEDALVMNAWRMVTNPINVVPVVYPAPTYYPSLTNVVPPITRTVIQHHGSPEMQWLFGRCCTTYRGQ